MRRRKAEVLTSSAPNLDTGSGRSSPHVSSATPFKSPRFGRGHRRATASGYVRARRSPA